MLVFVCRHRNQEQVMEGIMEPHSNDILMGRGGKNNQHVGNERLRGLARLQCASYRQASKKGKSVISRDLVRQVRMMNPPGRFLKRNADTGEFEDVGDDVAREKASQVLRDAVSVIAQSSDQASDDESSQGGKETEPCSEQRRPVSAPPVTVSEQRRRSWQEMETQPYQTRAYATRRYTSHMTPAPATSSAFYPPVTPSISSAKRRRYHSDTWDDRLVSRMHASPIVSQRQQRYIPRQYASEPIIHVRDCDSPEGRIGDVNVGLDEFDLFNGELLNSDGEEEASTTPVDLDSNAF
jgi:hypothetical protein